MEDLSIFKPVILPDNTSIIYQHRQGQSISSDTAAFIPLLRDFPTGQVRCLDIGSGCGIIAIIAKQLHSNWDITGIEIQPELQSLAQRNSSRLALAIDWILGDIRDYATLFPAHSFDCIVCNPPFYPVQSGKLSPNAIRAIARHEICCNMQDICNAIQYLLHPRGRSFLLYPESRLIELEKCIKKVDLSMHNKSLLVSKESANLKNRIVVEIGHVKPE